MSASPDRLLKPQEAAALLCISVRTLRDHVDSGKLPVVITGQGEKRRRFAIEPAAVEAFKRAQTEYRSPKGLPCQSINARGKRRSATTSQSGVIDIRDILKQLTGGKPNG